MGSIEFRVLGPLEVAVDGVCAELGGAKQRALLAELLLQAGHAVSRDALVDAIWGDDAPRSAVGSLQVYVHGLRRAFDANRIETSGAAYRLHVEPGELDLEQFRAAVKRARAALTEGRPAAAAADLDRALALWRGGALADLPGHAGGRALEQERLEAAELRNDAWLELGRHDLVLPALERLIADQPYRERLRAQQMLALYQAGRQAEALGAYRRASTVWRDELGVEPTPMLQELERAILRHDPSLSQPSLRAAEPRLPVPVTPLVGRRLEIAAVGALLRSDARLVTLVGPGGTGKTRLAIAAAAELAPELPGGAIFVDLSAVADPELVLPTVEQEAGDELRRREVLLVLDNFEQVLAAAGRISELLASAPQLRVLVTSRAPLRLAAEREYPVPPLPLPRPNATPAELEQNDAIRLFVERARTLDPAFALDTDAGRAVARLCRFLDGLPLAIELAAARTKLLAPAELADRLEQRPDTLGAGPRDVPARHATLVATIEWSYDLLRDDEREALTRLGVFAGGCTLAAAEQVCGITIDQLAALVDNSLVQRRRLPDGPRFALLETVRRFALDRLADGDEVRRRHAEWVAELAAQADAKVLGGGDSAVWLDRVEAEHDNVRVALAWLLETGAAELALEVATALRSFWEFRGHLPEGRRWLDEALAAGVEAPPDVRRKATGVAASLAFHSGDFERARELYADLLELARASDDAMGIARGLSDLGTVAAAVDDLDRAAELLRESVDAFNALGERGRAAIALANLGHVAQQRGDYDTAFAATLEALATEQELGDEPRAAVSLYNLGSFALHAGDLAESRRWLGQCFPLALQLGYREVLAYALSALVSLAVEEGDDLRAAELAGTADELLRVTGVALIPATSEIFRSAKDGVRARLGAEAYDAAQTAGRELTVEEALRRAGFA